MARGRSAQGTGSDEVFFVVVEDDRSTANEWLEVLDQIQIPGSDSSSEAVALEAFLDEKVPENFVNPWQKMAQTVADGVPSETDYVWGNWSYRRIAYEYLQSVKVQLDMNAD